MQQVPQVVQKLAVTTLCSCTSILFAFNAVQLSCNYITYIHVCPGGKGGRCVRVTILPPHSAESRENPEL